MNDAPTPPAGPADDDPAPTVLAPVGGTAAPVVWSDGLPATLPARLGRYELLKVLGKGGMGAVYLAHDGQLGRLVAVKVPHFGGPRHLQLRDRFLREARVAATLSHPNLCPVYDCGEVDGVLYLTMAYLEGRPLAQFIRPGQKLPPRAVVAVVRQLALAMAEAHAKGVIHRDLKPSNIMITPHKQPVIMDFGLARRTGVEDLQLTQTGLLMGTPAYMPPEQLNSDMRSIGPATDIYALGVILYELLSGRPPFQGPLGELMTRIMTEAPPPLARSRPDLPPALEAICSKALAKKPGERFASMKEFAAGLGDYLHGRYQVPEPEPEAYELVVDDARPLDEQDPAGLFRAMAARQTRSTRPRPHRRRWRFYLPPWLIPLTAGLVIVAPAVYGLWQFFQYLERRAQRQEAAAVAVAPGPGGVLDPAQAAEEQRRLAELKSLESAVKRWLKNPADSGARQEIDAWLDSPAARRMDLSSAVNLGLGRYLIQERDRWDAGVRRLALAGDGAWRRAAERDLAAAAAPADGGDAAAQVAAGDEWWQLADTLPVPIRPRLLARSKTWYDRALPQLSGVEADRVRRRVAAIEGPRRPA